VLGLDVDIREPSRVFVALAKAWPTSACEYDMVNSKK